MTLIEYEEAKWNAQEVKRLQADVGMYEAMKEGVAIRIAGLEAKIDRLRSIVNQLPKTADGVPIIPGMTLWATWEYLFGRIATRSFCCEFIESIDGQVYLYQSNTIRFEPSNCYSTCEAASAAKNKPTNT